MRVDELRDLSVKIRRNAITDIRLDESLPPVTGSSVLVEVVQGSNERSHRLIRIGTELHESIPQRFKVTPLSRRHAGEVDLVFKVRRESRISPHALKSAQLAVRQDAEQINDGCSIFTIIDVKGSIGHGLRLVPLEQHHGGAIPPWDSPGGILASGAGAYPANDEGREPRRPHIVRRRPRFPGAVPATWCPYGVWRTP